MSNRYLVDFDQHYLHTYMYVGQTTFWPSVKVQQAFVCLQSMQWNGIYKNCIWKNLLTCVSQFLYISFTYVWALITFWQKNALKIALLRKCTFQHQHYTYVNTSILNKMRYKVGFTTNSHKIKFAAKMAIGHPFAQSILCFFNLAIDKFGGIVNSVSFFTQPLTNLVSDWGKSLFPSHTQHTQ